MTGEVLSLLGMPSSEVARTLATFRSHDEQLLMDSFQHRGDVSTLQERAKQARADLERVLTQMHPADVVREVSASGLRGRGGLSLRGHRLGRGGRARLGRWGCRTCARRRSTSGCGLCWCGCRCGGSRLGGQLLFHLAHHGCGGPSSGALARTVSVAFRLVDHGDDDVAGIVHGKGGRERGDHRTAAISADTRLFGRPGLAPDAKARRIGLLAGSVGHDQAEQLPHPRAIERAFVMVPWAEVAPDAVIGGQRVADVAARMPCHDIARIEA